MRLNILLAGLIASLTLFGSGCGERGELKNLGGPVAVVDATGSSYLLAEEPEGAKGVMDVKQTAKDGDDVLIVGRVGGDKKPFLEGLAGFTIVDTSLKSCADIPGDTCPNPWDYCCEDPTEVKKGKALVKFVDDSGNTLKKDARDLLGVAPLETVVVRGKAKRDSEGNLTVLASAVHVRGK